MTRPWSARPTTCATKPGAGSGQVSRTIIARHGIIKFRASAQCAGGCFVNGKISHIGGGVDVGDNRILETARVYEAALSKVRMVEWVTFGGVYIRNEVLSCCGPIDQRYRWAYVMDVDYCLEARSRGFELFQVPVNITHFESRAMKRMKLFNAENNKLVAENHRLFYEKWGGWLKRNQKIPSPPPTPWMST